jgi:hypothetical protein
MSARDIPGAWWDDESPISTDRRRPPDADRNGARPDGGPQPDRARPDGGPQPDLPPPDPWAATGVPDPGPIPAPGPGRGRPDRPEPRRGPPVVEPGPPSSAPRQIFVPPPEELPPFEDELVGAAVAPPLRRDDPVVHDPVPDAPVLADGAARVAPARAPARARPTRIDRKRLAVVYDIDGPRIRLGVAWFVGALAATVASPYTAALAFAVAAGFAGRQIVRAWGSVSWQADVAAGIAALPVLAAAVAGVPGAVGAAVLGVAVAIGAACATDGARFAGSGGRVAAAGIMILALVPALGAACVVLVRTDSIVAAAVLVVVASAYEVGDYIVGSGASNPVEGPLAGITTATLVALPLALVLVEPYDTGGVALLVFVALACPFGQIVASAALPGAGAPAPALRRIDTLLVLALIWAAAAAAF